MIATLILPYIMNFVQSFMIAYKATKNNIIVRILFFIQSFFALSTGNFHLFAIDANLTSEVDGSKQDHYRYINCCIMNFCEDLPQFLMQTWNTMLVGQQMTAIQIASPLISALILSVRAPNIAKPDASDKIIIGYWNFKMKKVVYFNIFVTWTFLVTTLILVLGSYDYKDNRVAWAKANFEVIQNEDPVYN